MKKGIFVCLLFCFIFVSPVYADDIVRSIIKQKQDALVIGEIVSVNKKSIEIKVNQVITGKVKDKKITILYNQPMVYTILQTNPQVNDYCIASINKFSNKYKIAWGVFQSTGDNYKTVKIEGSSNDGDLAALQYYVNSGGKQTEFYFDLDEVYVKGKDGKPIKIFPSSQIVSGVLSVDNDNNVTTNVSPLHSIGQNKIITAFVVFTLLMSGIIGIYIIRK